jgi:hypothetical protein
MKLFFKGKKNNIPNHFCCFEEPEFFIKINDRFNLSFDLRDYSEKNYDYICKLWNRYVRFKTKDQSSIFIFSSPLITGLGYPSRYISYLSTLIFIKKNKIKSFFIHTKKNDLIGHFNKKINIIIILKLFFLDFIDVLRMLKKCVQIYFFRYQFSQKDINKKTIIVHSYHDDSFIKENNRYITSKIPDLESVTQQYSFSLLYDLNPSFISRSSLKKLKGFPNIITSANNLNFLQFLNIFIQSIWLGFTTRFLFKTFSFEYTSIFSTTFMNILKRRSISLLLKNKNVKYYLIPWENRGYQLGIEKDLKGDKIVFLSTHLISKVCPEYVNYQFIKRYKRTIHLAMSDFTSRFLKEHVFKKNYIIFRQPRVFDLKETNKILNNNKILIICGAPYNYTFEILSFLKKNKCYQYKVKPHPMLKIPEEFMDLIEINTLKTCMQNYSHYICQGRTTATMEVFLYSKNILNIPIQFDYNIDLLNNYEIHSLNLKDLPSIESLSDMDKLISLNKEYNLDVNYFLGINEQKIETIIENHIKLHEY